MHMTRNAGQKGGSGSGTVGNWQNDRKRFTSLIQEVKRQPVKALVWTNSSLGTLRQMP